MVRPHTVNSPILKLHSPIRLYFSSRKNLEVQHHRSFDIGRKFRFNYLRTVICLFKKDLKPVLKVQVMSRLSVHLCMCCLGAWLSFQVSDYFSQFASELRAEISQKKCHNRVSNPQLPCSSESDVLTPEKPGQAIIILRSPRNEP